MVKARRGSSQEVEKNMKKSEIKREIRDIKEVNKDITTNDGNIRRVDNDVKIKKILGSI